MREIDISADRLVRALLQPGVASNICLLDSCGVGKQGSNLLLTGVDPLETIKLSMDEPVEILAAFDERLTNNDLAAIFTLSYDLGLKLNGLTEKDALSPREPDLFLALFDCLVVHDYNQGRTFLTGNTEKFERIESLLCDTACQLTESLAFYPPETYLKSNFTRFEYVAAVEEIKELIRSGETYQTNLTQQLTVPLQEKDSPQKVFLRLRTEHPAPFAAFIQREDSTVVSASPEEFIRIRNLNGVRQITASPIKGTRPRGKSKTEDERLRAELLGSEKDRAENTMIVDLMRNDLGRICEFGSVGVDGLCRVEEHPTLFHLVSTVNGLLKKDVSFSDIIRATFPCGSITGAPKIRTMEIIEKLEPTPRGLSMGAIGCRIPAMKFGLEETFEMSVAIRTMVIREQAATFNVGGGIVIDSDSQGEYEESMLKAKALLHALNAR